MKKYKLLLPILFCLSTPVLAQDYYVTISTPQNHGAIYSMNSYIDKTPFSGKIDMERVGQLYVTGENDLFAEIPESELKKKQPLTFYPIDLSTLDGQFKNIFFSGVSVNEFASTQVTIIGTTINSENENKILNDACERLIKNTNCLSMDKENELVLSGKFKRGFETSDRGTYSTKHYTAFRTIEWTLKNELTGEVLFNKEVTGGHYIKKLDPKFSKMLEEKSFAYRKAIMSSLTNLLTDEEFEKATNVVADLTNISEKDTLTISKNTEYCASLEQCITATVTIKASNGIGSGFFINKNGYILTNSHVVKDEEAPLVILSNGIKVPCAVIRQDKVADVALLKIELSGLPSLKLGVVAAPKVGDTVFAIGTPKNLELGQTVTKGVISGFRSGEKEYIQTDVGINEGNSGGPLLNEQFEVIGIVTAKFIGIGTESLGFAIPVANALDALNLKLDQSQ